MDNNRCIRGIIYRLQIEKSLKFTVEFCHIFTCLHRDRSGSDGSSDSGCSRSGNTMEVLRNIHSSIGSTQRQLHPQS